MSPRGARVGIIRVLLSIDCCRSSSPKKIWRYQSRADSPRNARTMRSPMTTTRVWVWGGLRRNRGGFRRIARAVTMGIGSLGDWGVGAVFGYPEPFGNAREPSRRPDHPTTRSQGPWIVQYRVGTSEAGRCFWMVSGQL